MKFTWNSGIFSIFQATTRDKKCQHLGSFSVIIQQNKLTKTLIVLESLMLSNLLHTYSFNQSSWPLFSNSSMKCTWNSGIFSIFQATTRDKKCQHLGSFSVIIQQNKLTKTLIVLESLMLSNLLHTYSFNQSSWPLFSQQ